MTPTTSTRPASSIDESVGPVSKPTDGRNLRRARNRQAVIDAALALVFEGNHSPSLEAMAAHSGVSYRSVYRYFKDRDELLVEMAKRGAEVATPLVELPDAGTGPLQERIDRFIESRIALHESTVGLSVAARSSLATQSVVVEVFERLRLLNIDVIDRHFASELDTFGAEQRLDIVHAIYLAFLFESLRFLVEQNEDDPNRVRRILSHHIRLHLGTL